MSSAEKFLNLTPRRLVKHYHTYQHNETFRINEDLSLAAGDDHEIEGKSTTNYFLKYFRVL